MCFVAKAAYVRRRSRVRSANALVSRSDCVGRLSPRPHCFRRVGATPRGDGRGYNLFYSQIEISRLADVRFTPESGH